MAVNNAQTINKDIQDQITPAIALDLLQEGNQRFLEKRMLDRDLNEQVRQTTNGQHPFAVVLGCIDSRVPSELIFDQGIGDIFNARVAGNFVNEDILGSLEYSCKVAGSKIIVVLGHESCGAVKSACDDVQLGNITAMLSKLKPAVEAVTDITEDRNSGNAKFVQKVVNANVLLTIAAIKKHSPILNEMYEDGVIDIVGAVYHVSDGTVHFFE